MSAADVAVIGLGNRWRGDDAAGLEVAPALRSFVGDARSAAASAGIHGRARVVEFEGDPAALIDRWRRTDDVVLVDAVVSGSPPGAVHRLDASDDPLPSAFARSSTHVFSVAEAIELARALDRMPRRLRIYGIEGEDFGHGTPLMPAIRQAVDVVVGELRAQLIAPRRERGQR